MKMHFRLLLHIFIYQTNKNQKDFMSSFWANELISQVLYWLEGEIKEDFWGSVTVPLPLSLEAPTKSVSASNTPLVTWGQRPASDSSLPKLRISWYVPDKIRFLVAGEEG